MKARGAAPLDTVWVHRCGDGWTWTRRDPVGSVTASGPMLGDRAAARAAAKRANPDTDAYRLRADQADR